MRPGLYLAELIVSKGVLQRKSMRIEMHVLMAPKGAPKPQTLNTPTQYAFTNPTPDSAKSVHPAKEPNQSLATPDYHGHPAPKAIDSFFSGDAKKRREYLQALLHLTVRAF